MRLHSLTVCTDDEDKLSGLNFHLASNPYSDAPGERVDLGAIGKMEGDCKSLKLSKSIDRIFDQYDGPVIRLINSID